MKYIILCGGIGKQTATQATHQATHQATLPKPLNFIQGRQMIEYVVDNIPSNEVFIIYNIFLDEYNFQEILINKCKSKKFHFSQIDYLTRGAVETAFVGINKFLGECGDDNIVFIDSDNPPNIDKPIPIFNNEFIGYNQTTHSICYGLCGFKNVNTFLKYVKMLLAAASECDAATEFHFSTLYNLITNNGVKVEHYHIDNLDIANNNNKLRICFDLDNTLVSYPTIAGDYSTVKPIAHNLSLLKRLKNDGHEIIIYTARRMKTHGGNVGKVIKDIAGITIDTLERLNIEYDELIFGKPIADIYIDDRAINPYINDVSFFGLSYGGGSGTSGGQFIPNKIKNNKYNQIKRCGEHIVKTGPFNILRGELYYYQNIPSGFENYFPKLIDYKNYEDTIELKIEYIEGIPLYYLYKNRLLTHKHIDELFDILDRLHKHNSANPIIITSDNVKNNYIKKLENRFNIQDYYFEDARDVLKDITDGIETHFNPVISPVIHGDFWFSNIILSYEGCGCGVSGVSGVSGGCGYRLIDMKGTIDNILTVNGDIYYDYGKLYQSILGYDLILNDCESTEQTKEYIQSMKAYFLQKCIAKRLDITYLKCVVKGLVFGTMPFISHYSRDIKNNIWELIKGDLLNSGHI